MIFILAQILPPFFQSCRGNQTYYDKSDQLNQFLCTLNQNETFAFYGSILFGIHLQVCLQGLSRESEISIKGHLWILVLFVINCQLWHWPWWVKAIWCWSMKIRQLTLTISRNLCRLAGGGRWPPQVPLHTRQRQFPPWQDVATALSSGHSEAMSSINNTYWQCLLQMYLSGHTLS